MMKHQICYIPLILFFYNLPPNVIKFRLNQIDPTKKHVQKTGKRTKVALFDVSRTKSVRYEQHFPDVFRTVPNVFRK